MKFGDTEVCRSWTSERFISMAIRMQTLMAKHADSTSSIPRHHLAEIPFGSIDKAYVIPFKCLIGYKTNKMTFMYKLAKNYDIITKSLLFPCVIFFLWLSHSHLEICVSLRNDDTNRYTSHHHYALNDNACEQDEHKEETTY